ncbi:Heparan-alpha-glucosaminide N-acetyltransferase, partial [Geodia barretti]
PANSLTPPIFVSPGPYLCSQCLSLSLSLLSLSPSLPAILYAAVGILGLALVWGAAKILWLVLRDRGCFHYLHFKSVDRVTARDLGYPRKVNSEYGAVNPQETEPLNRTNDSSVNGLMGAPADQSVKSGSGGGEATGKTPGRRRLASLDTFRGFSLMIMIFVNYGGGGYWFFDHSRWNGLTVADLVFPWFIWIMGVSIVFSYKSRTKHTILSRLYQLVRRSVILFGLGLFLNNGFTLGRWRIPGVLQRFAISYFVVALTELLTSEIRNSLCSLTPKGRILGIFRDITSNVFQWTVVFVLELLWLVLTFLLPLPQPCPRKCSGFIGGPFLGNLHAISGVEHTGRDTWAREDWRTMGDTPTVPVELLE